MDVFLPWMVFCAALVVLMQGGFALANAGLCRAKSAGQVASMNLFVLPLCLLGFWVCGYAICFGGVDLNHEVGPGVAGGAGFFLNGAGRNPTLLRFLFYSSVFAVAVSIPSGAMAERWRFSSFILYGLVASALPFALYGNWVWGGGWLAQLGKNFALGHGYVDFAGSSVIHLAGGIVALAGAAALGPRVGKYGLDGRPRPLPGHNLVYLILGTIILSVGWLGLNLGPALSVDRIALVAVNTLLAGAAGAVAACLVVMLKFGKPDPSMLCNGLLAGLVASSAPCAFVNPAGSVLIGAVAGILVVYSVLWVESKLKIDDPVGAISVHGVSGLWGTLSVGLFADGSFGSNWNGVGTATTSGVTGALGTLFGAHNNDWSQLVAQVAGAGTAVVFFGFFALLWFKISPLIVPLRSKREAEIAGLDLPEMGAECYPDFHLIDKSSTHGNPTD